MSRQEAFEFMRRSPVVDDPYAHLLAGCDMHLNGRKAKVLGDDAHIVLIRTVRPQPAKEDDALPGSVSPAHEKHIHW
jgi:hypothetical protein